MYGGGPSSQSWFRHTCTALVLKGLSLVKFRVNTEKTTPKSPAKFPSYNLLRFLCYIILTPPTKHLCLEEAGMWCLNGLENGKQVVKRTGVVGHKFLSKKRLMVES